MKEHGQQTPEMANLCQMKIAPVIEVCAHSLKKQQTENHSHLIV